MGVAEDLKMTGFANDGFLTGPKISHFRGFTVIVFVTRTAVASEPSPCCSQHYSIENYQKNKINHNNWDLRSPEMCVVINALFRNPPFLNRRFRNVDCNCPWSVAAHHPVVRSTILLPHCKPRGSRVVISELPFMTTHISGLLKSHSS